MESHGGRSCGRGSRRRRTATRSPGPSRGRTAGRCAPGAAGWTWTRSAACSVAPLPGHASGARHARPEDSRRPDGQGAGQCLGHCVPPERRRARHGKAGPASHHSQRHARPAAGCRRSRGVRSRPGWTAGGPAASALRREPVSLSDVLEIARAHARNAGAAGCRSPTGSSRSTGSSRPARSGAAARRDDRAGARAIRRQGVDGRARAPGRRQLEHREPALRRQARVRPRRHALPDDRGAGRSQPRAEHGPPRRKDPAAQGGRHRGAGQSVCRTRRVQAGDLHVRPPQPAGARVPSGDGRALVNGTWTTGRRRAQHDRRRKELRLADRDVRPRIQRGVHQPAVIARVSSCR